MGLQNKRIISVATTGSYPTKRENPNVPVTPQEIAEDIYQCFLAGAAIAHVHVRDEEQKPSMKVEYFAQVKEGVEAYKDCDIILNFTTSGGVIWTEDQRMEPALTLKPEMASFDCGSMNWQHNSVFNNNPHFLERLGTELHRAGIKPEIEVFNSGMIAEAKFYLKKGVLHAPLHFQCCMGVAGGAIATAKELMHMKELLPEDATWSAFGVGKGSMEIMYTAIALGGHVRVGMEDNIKITKDRLAESNAQLVMRAKQAIELFGCEVAAPDEARRILQIV